MNDFCTDLPGHENALVLFAGFWKDDFENASEEQLAARILGDSRPRYSTGQFRNFARMRILELGPSDGYNAVGLEWTGARKQAYLRCLVMKNRFNLQATFLLGDFTKYPETTRTRYDFICASGVL